MGKSRKSKPDDARGGNVDTDELVVSLIQTVLRERLGQGSLPPEICGFEKERRYN